MDINEINNSTADGLVELIRRIVREEISSALRQNNNDKETFRHCLVVNTQDQTETKDSKKTVVATISADIKDLGTGEIQKSVSNKSGEILNAGDTVRIYETNGSYNNCYIGLKCS